MVNLQIPSGLLDCNIELFNKDWEPMAIHQGQVKPLFDLPEEFLEIIESDLNKNVSAKLALMLSGFTDRESQVKKYVACRLGGLDNSPDILCGKMELGKSEYHECGFRGECPMEGIVCGTLVINDRVITPFEIRMIQQLATEKTLPVIAEALKISINNFESRKKILFEKLKVLSRARMVAVAYELQILTPASCSA